MLGYISVSRAHSFRRKNMTWIKWLLRFLPVGFAIFGVLFVRHRIKLNYSTFRIITTIVESIIVTIIACAIPIVYEKTANDLSSDTMISAPASIPNITYGQAIEAACTDVNWGYFNSFSNKDGQHLIVEVNADGGQLSWIWKITRRTRINNERNFIYYVREICFSKWDYIR